jgi:hypothetical protein
VVVVALGVGAGGCVGAVVVRVFVGT